MLPSSSDHAGKLEQLNRQVVQNERWITIGRAVAAISHDIMNRMQAIQGASTLVMEDPSISAETRAYLEICVQETRRVVTQVNRLRRIYHPEADTIQEVNVPELLAEVATLAADAARSGTVRIETIAAGGPTALPVRAGQLQFVLLGTLLNLIDVVDTPDPVDIRIETRQLAAGMEFEISTAAPLPEWARGQDAQSIQESALGLPTFREIVAAQGGTLAFILSDASLAVRIQLPLAAAVQ